MTSNRTSLGYFLTFVLWKEALKLLNFQISSQEKNKHFKTLSMIYYKKLGIAVSDLEPEEYFESKVANNLFYGLEKEFAILPYVVPKSGLGLRNYKFLTYPMRALYYAIGLYFLKLSEEFLNNFFNKRKYICSYYGGRIYFDKDELKVTKNNIYFKSYYKSFRNRIRKEVSKDVNRKIIIRLDIQDYYDEISIPTLLEHLDIYIKSSQKANMRFDATTKDQIAFFFRFLANGGDGIPQSDNDLLSSFIGYLYLVFGDLFIEQELYKCSDVVDKYLLIRYIDDIFISITFKEDMSERAQKKYAEALGSQIADLLYYRLGLRLNPKTRFFCLSDEKQQKELRDSLKKVSPKYHLSDDEDDEAPANKISNIFDELKKLKKASIEPETFEHELRDEILKEVFDDRVNQMLDWDVNKKRIRRIFTDFDFDHVKEYPLPMLIVLLKEPSTAKRFRQFLLQKSHLITRDVDLISQYLCQLDFQDWEMLAKLKQYEPMSCIMNIFESASLYTDLPGYYELPGTKTLRLSQRPYVIEQVRYRILNERTESYSVALNHLLNEIHAICYELDNSSNSKDYNGYKADQVVNFLDTCRVSPEICIGIRNLFDRRNTNQVSHPGSEEYITWSVTAEDYRGYRAQVGECLASLL